MSLNLENIKDQFTGSLRSYLYPSQINYSNTISLNFNTILTQRFIPFSNTISNFMIYLSDVTGSPGAATVRLLYGSSTLATYSTVPAIGWNTFTVNARELVTKRECTLIICGGVDASNDYLFGCDSASTYFFGNSGTFNLAFNVEVSDFVYNVFPMRQLELDQYPAVALDISGRPKVDDRYFTGQSAWYRIAVKAEVYSRYTDEVDKLISAMDRGIFRDRENFDGFRYVTPGQMSELYYIKPEVFSRNITWTVMKLISKQ